MNTDFLVTLALVFSVASTIGVVILLVQQSRTKQGATDIDKQLNRLESILKQEFALQRDSHDNGNVKLRSELSGTLKGVSDTLDKRMFETSSVIERRLENIQKDNSSQLERMRNTVDEKLHATLEKRLGESFKLVSDRLELVHKGLGEMQNLATGVGDLKKVLSNVKVRGTWGEVQLGNLLEQLLTPEQYAKNVVTKPGSKDRVEFAIKLPGRDDSQSQIWLPIDAKFPLEDYQALVTATENIDPAMVLVARKALENRIKAEAKDIAEKYIDPPQTTDFALLYLPVEGLFAEVIQNQELCDMLQRQLRVMVTGPSTISALLNSLQMGFRTLAIEKRSSEVWSVLGAVKTEFGRFGDLLDKTQKKLQEATNTIQSASAKSRTIESKLKKVQLLEPAGGPIDPALPLAQLAIDEEFSAASEPGAE